MDSRSFDHFFANPIFRHSVGLGAAALLVLLAFLYFQGVARYVLVALAAIDAVYIPRLLRRIADASHRSVEDEVV